MLDALTSYITLTCDSSYYVIAILVHNKFILISLFHEFIFKMVVLACW
jgi:hypothetical protein